MEFLELSTGGCMGNFRWDGGSKRKFFDDSLPTDSAVNEQLFDYCCSIISLIISIPI